MNKPIQFEKSILELETIVNQLEKGELSLEDALKEFEKGVTLARKCQETLNQAEQKIELLSVEHGAVNKSDD
jgi:exodeoxyribonuclease VII small subunit